MSRSNSSRPASSAPLNLSIQHSRRLFVIAPSPPLVAVGVHPKERTSAAYGRGGGSRPAERLDESKLALHATIRQREDLHLDLLAPHSEPKNSAAFEVEPLITPYNVGASSSPFGLSVGCADVGAEGTTAPMEIGVATAGVVPRGGVR
jgi:hypothetical protein